jgi:hypothetical protein
MIIRMIKTVMIMITKFSNNLIDIINNSDADSSSYLNFIVVAISVLLSGRVDKLRGQGDCGLG